MPINRRSRNITEGVARAPNRSMFYAMGYEAGDFAKPMIGVANGHSTITPCNSGLQKLADAAVAGIEEAGGNAQIFGTPTISDGMAMGTEGMKYSLASREVIADCIETCVGGQWMDGVLVVGGCDKNMPGGMMGILRANVPAIYVYGGTILPGRYQGKDLNIVSVFEAVGQFTAGTLSEHDLGEIERRAIPGSGSCGGMYTANTMSSAIEALGMSLPFSSTMANVHDEIVASARASAKVLVEAVRQNIRPRDIVTRKSIENAIAVVMATGGSTNAVLHFLAIAHTAGVEWTIDDFERVRRRVPVLCDLKPSGRYMAVDLHRAGGIPQVMKVLLEAGLLHGDCMTITGKTIAETLAEIPAVPRADQDVIRPIGQPMYAEGHLAILKGNLSPEGAVAKITGLKNPVITGPARVFDDEQSAMTAILDQRIVAGDVMILRYLGPKGAPGHAGDARADRGADRPGPRRDRRPRHRRALLGRHLGHGRRPRRARGLRRRDHRPGAGGRLGHHRRAQAAAAAQRRRGRDRAPPRPLGGAEAALHPGRAGQVREERLDRQPRRGARRRLGPVSAVRRHA